MQVLKIAIVSVFILSISLPGASFALSEDAKAKVYIDAGSSIYNYKSGVKIFEGNVKIDQGTTHITADRVVTKSNPQHKMQEIVAYGYKTLAHYWTLPKVGDPIMHARAEVIKFYPLTSNVILERKVTVLQGENSFQGELILYNNGDKTITVPASKTGRAVLVYNPDKTPNQTPDKPNKT